MKKQTTLLVIMCILALVFLVTSYVGRNAEPQPIAEVPQAAQQPIARVPASFAWIYEEDASLNPDGNHQTRLSLEAKYSDNSSLKRQLGVMQGGCYPLEDSDKDRVASSSQIQCYYAGLGYRFKVIKGTMSYEVLRKEFEEGTADYAPPEQAYEKVAEFPF